MTCSKCQGEGLMKVPAADDQWLIHYPSVLCGFCFGTGFDSPSWKQLEPLAKAIRELKRKGLVGNK